MYLLIKYIKSVLWRVAKRLSLYTGRTVPRERAFKQFKSPVLNVLTGLVCCVKKIKEQGLAHYTYKKYPCVIVEHTTNAYLKLVAD